MRSHGLTVSRCDILANDADLATRLKFTPGVRLRLGKMSGDIRSSTAAFRRWWLFSNEHVWKHSSAFLATRRIDECGRVDVLSRGKSCLRLSSDWLRNRNGYVTIRYYHHLVLYIKREIPLYLSFFPLRLSSYARHTHSRGGWQEWSFLSSSLSSHEFAFVVPTCFHVDTRFLKHC